MQEMDKAFGIRGFLIDTPEFGTIRAHPKGAVVIHKGRIAEVGDYDNLRRVQRPTPVPVLARVGASGPTQGSAGPRVFAKTNAERVSGTNAPAAHPVAVSDTWHSKFAQPGSRTPKHQRRRVIATDQWCLVCGRDSDDFDQLNTRSAVNAPSQPAAKFA